jgi:hypothetical protein
MFSNPQTPPGIAEIDAEVHRRGFSPESGGTVWTIRRVERGQPRGETPGPRLPPFPDVKFYETLGLGEKAREKADEVATAFQRLQVVQQEHDALQRELASWQWEYYAAWFKSQLEYKPSGMNPDALPQEMERVERPIGATRDRIGQSKATLAALKGAIQRAEGFTGEAPTYELLAQDMPRFWRANDPAVLLHGVRPSQKYAAGPDAEALACRVVSQVLTGLAFAWKGNVLEPAPGGAVRVSAASLLPETAAPGLPLEEMHALLAETLLLDPGMADAVAQKAYQQAGRGQPAGSRLLQELAGKIRQALAEPTGVQARQLLTGTSPAACALRQHEQAWSPLFMLWEAEWCPTAVDPHHWSQHWVFRNNTDYKATANAPDGLPRFTVAGWVPVSFSVAQNLQERLKKVQERCQGALGDLGVLIEQFGTWPLLTQSLSGLSSALIMREQTLQLPPLRADDLSLDRRVHDLIGGTMESSPLEGAPSMADDPARFCPIRAGHMQLRRLWVVDAFGQALKVVDTAPHVSTTLTAAESLTGVQPTRPSWISLPPRIMQPARLLFRCISAANAQQETTSDPATSPICGWIVPNHFDKSLLVFDAQGRLQGQLQVIADQTRPVWSGRPGAAASPDPNAEPELSDPHLKAFLTHLKARGNLALTALLEHIDQCSLCVTTAGARQVQSLSVLVGQPLPLVRASLKLELMGRPATDQSWAQASSPNSRGFPSVKFPVWLGDMRQGNDGLIGYFLEDDYTQLRPAFGTSLAAHAGRTYFQVDSPIALSFTDAPTKVTLLMDPRAGVHASSGILPTQFLELPPYETAEALEHMDLAFSVGPFIGGSERLRLPLPKEIAGKWSWGHFRGLGVWQADEEIDQPDSAPGVPTTPLQIYEGWLVLHRGLGQSDRP